MVSSVLNSNSAIAVNIRILTKIRDLLSVTLSLMLEAEEIRKS
jgi:hypothetical protein